MSEVFTVIPEACEAAAVKLIGVVVERFTDISLFIRVQGFWPAVFSFSKPQPLKVGITAELMADVETRGLPFTLEMLKSSLALYTNRIDYVRALADGCQRIGLDGSPAGEPTEEQRARARKQLRRLWARQRKADRAKKAAQEAAG